MQQPGNTDPKKNPQYMLNMTIAAVISQVGFLTLLVIFIALFAGLWLDNHFGTRPAFTAGLLIVSVPFTVFGMFWIVRKATAKMKPLDKENSSQED